MPRIEERLSAKGLVLPAPIKVAAGVSLPFHLVRIVGARAFISGHGPQNADGSIAEPLGKVGRDPTVEQGYAAGRLVGLSMLGSLQRALGDLDRIVHGQRVLGRANSALRAAGLSNPCTAAPEVFTGMQSPSRRMFSRRSSTSRMFSCA
jgi:hypothetical protein